MSKKTLILQEVYDNHKTCEDVFTCTNDEIKALAKKHNFKNPFDVTKVDKEELLPNNMREAGFQGIFYGKSGPYFVRRNCFCSFPVAVDQCQFQVPKNPFLATKANSENLPVIYLPQIIQEFFQVDSPLHTGIFGRCRNINIKLELLEEDVLSFNCNQIEIDMSYFYQQNDIDYIVYCEMKRSKNKTFNANQLYHCFMFNEYVSQCNNKEYIPLFLMINSMGPVVCISQYKFMEKYQPWSIQCVRSKQYHLEYV